MNFFNHEKLLSGLRKILIFFAFKISRYFLEKIAQHILSRNIFKLPCLQEVCPSGFSSPYPVVQKMDSAIHWINLCSGDKAVGFLNTYSLDGDLSDV